MRIIGIERDSTACNYYRVRLPLTKLREHGLADCVLLNEYELSTDHAVEKVLESDVVVFQRPANDDWFNFIKVCRKNGKIIVSDYDDDPFNTSPLNPYYKVIGIRDYGYKWPSGEVDMVWENGVDGFDIERNIIRRDMFTASFRKSDMVTTTTDILKDTLSEMNNNVRILPNLIDFDLYQKTEMVKKEVRIGYQCGASHYEDLYMVRDHIKAILQKHDNVKFVYLGDYRFASLFQDIPRNKFEFHSWVPHAAYPYKLSLLNLDIGICPLVDNVFNRNKSAIKHFEYATVGAATIASDIPPYSPCIENGRTGLLVKDDQWTKAMDELILNEEKRKELAKNAYDDVYENHNVDKKIHLWKDAYETLVKEEVMV